MALRLSVPGIVCLVAVPRPSVEMSGDSDPSTPPSPSSTASGGGCGLTGPGHIARAGQRRDAPAKRRRVGRGRCGRCGGGQASASEAEEEKTGGGDAAARVGVDPAAWGAPSDENDSESFRGDKPKRAGRPAAGGARIIPPGGQKRGRGREDDVQLRVPVGFLKAP